MSVHETKAEDDSEGFVKYGFQLTEAERRKRINTGVTIAPNSIVPTEQEDQLHGISE